MSLEKILELLKHLNEQELISAREAQRWLAEIGVMFESLRQKDKLCVVLRDDKTQDEEKLREYRKFQNIYKLVDLKKRPDLAKVDKFKKMLDDNVEQFYAIFMEQLKDVDSGESDFDYDTTSGGEQTSSDSMSMDDLMEIVRKKMHPDYNEDALKECLCRTYAPHFEKIAGKIRPMEKTVDNLFRVLNTESLDTLDGVDSVVKESLNMLCMAEGLSANEKRMHLNQLLMKYEAFLKKLYYLINHKELEGKNPGKDATLSSAIFGIPSLKKLKYSEDPEVKAFSDRLDILRQLRNDEAHGSYIATELEVDAAIGIVIDMYLYVAGTNTILVAKRYELPTEETNDHHGQYGHSLQMAAEPLSVKDLDEATRLEILRECVIKLLNYGYNKKNGVFTKQRHWEAVYRIAADYGFVIDGDYDYFKRVIEDIDIQTLPYALTNNFLKNNNTGIYAKNMKDWTSEGLAGKALAEYEDIKKCAEVFEKIVGQRINKTKNQSYDD